MKFKLNHKGTERSITNHYFHDIKTAILILYIKTFHIQLTMTPIQMPKPAFEVQWQINVAQIMPNIKRRSPIIISKPAKSRTRPLPLP